MKLFLLFWCFPFALFAQNCQGLLLDADSEQPIAYANIGMLSRALGTVSGEDGRFQFSLENTSTTDSLKISMIGYEALQMSLADFAKTCGATATWYLKPLAYELEEVLVVPKDYVEKRVGNKTDSKNMQAGMMNNNLGHEFGTLMKANKRKKAIVKSLRLNFARCIYDSIFVRLNIYEVKKKIPGKNLLSRPIYLSYSQAEVLQGLELDLEEEHIEVEGDFLVTIELVKDLGEKGLYFSANPFGSKTYYRETSQAAWNTIFVGIGISAIILQEK